MQSMLPSSIWQWTFNLWFHLSIQLRWIMISLSRVSLTRTWNRFQTICSSSYIHCLYNCRIFVMVWKLIGNDIHDAGDGVIFFCPKAVLPEAMNHVNVDGFHARTIQELMDIQLPQPFWLNASLWLPDDARFNQCICLEAPSSFVLRTWQTPFHRRTKFAWKADQVRCSAAAQCRLKCRSSL